MVKKKNHYSGQRKPQDLISKSARPFFSANLVKDCYGSLAD
jgi:hypothetical protein